MDEQDGTGTESVAGSNWTIPNVLTLGRLLLVPLFAIMFVKGWPGLALGVFFAAGLTDGLDGFLARLLRQRSRLGAILDPLADKLLLDTAYICLGYKGLLPTWLVILVISRDLFIIGGMAVLNFSGVTIKSIRPTYLSKLNTLGQMVLVLAALGADALGPGHAFHTGLELWTEALVPVVGGLTAGSGLHYVFKGFSLLPGGRS
jgi:cardiolipin synthase